MAKARTKTTKGKSPKKQGRPSGGRAISREAILRAVCKLLRTRSYSQVTLAVVARELKVDPAAIRYYFRDHGTLMLLAGQAMYDEFTSVMGASLAASDGTPEGLLRARIHGLMEVGMRYPFIMRLLTDITYLNPNPNARKALQRITEASVGFYQRLIDGAVASGQFQRVEPMFLTMAAVGIVDAFTIQEPLFRARRRLGVRTMAELRARYEAFAADLLVNALKAPRGQ